MRPVHQEHQLPEIGLSAQVDHAVERRMMMRRFPNLDELNAVAKSIHDLLIPLRRPPFDCVVELSARYEQPVRHRMRRAGDDGIRPRFFRG